MVSIINIHVIYSVMQEILLLYDILNQETREQKMLHA